MRVEISRLFTIHDRNFDFFAWPHGGGNVSAGTNVVELHLHDGVALARLVVVGLQYLDKLAILNKDHPRFQINCFSHILCSPSFALRRNGAFRV